MKGKTYGGLSDCDMIGKMDEGMSGGPNEKMVDVLIKKWMNG